MREKSTGNTTYALYTRTAQNQDIYGMPWYWIKDQNVNVRFAYMYVEVWQPFKIKH